MSLLEDEQESWRLSLEEAQREGEFTNMATRTYVFIVEKPDDSYDIDIDADSLREAHAIMQARIQPDWLAYHLKDIIDHDEDEDEESE